MRGAGIWEAGRHARCTQAGTGRRPAAQAHTALAGTHAAPMRAPSGGPPPRPPLRLLAANAPSPPHPGDFLCPAGASCPLRSSLPRVRSRLPAGITAWPLMPRALPAQAATAAACLPTSALRCSLSQANQATVLVAQLVNECAALPACPTCSLWPAADDEPQVRLLAVLFVLVAPVPCTQLATKALSAWLRAASLLGPTLPAGGRSFDPCTAG